MKASSEGRTTGLPCPLSPVTGSRYSTPVQRQPGIVPLFDWTESQLVETDLQEAIRTFELDTLPFLSTVLLTTPNINKYTLQPFFE